MKQIMRIVRLSFDPYKIEHFIDLFESSKDKISAFDGCTSLQLKRDEAQDNVFYTVSQWESNDHLQNYRHSALFKNVWGKTKVLFNEKPMAFSLVDL